MKWDLKGILYLQIVAAYSIFKQYKNIQKSIKIEIYEEIII